MNVNLSSSESEFLEDSDNDCNESLVEEFVESFCGLEPYNFDQKQKGNKNKYGKLLLLSVVLLIHPVWLNI